MILSSNFQHLAKCVHTNRSVQSVLCGPCSWLWRPLWCGPPPAGSVCGHVLRSLWPLWAQTPEPSRAPPLPAGASLAWAAHSAGQHYHVPTTQRKERQWVCVCVERESTWYLIFRKSDFTCLCTLVSCSRLFSRNEIFCFCAALPPVSSESISALWNIR